MRELSEDVIRAAGSGTPIDDKKLEALRLFTHKMVDQRGVLNEGELDAFLAAGYTPENALEVVLGIAMKTLSNYANHLMDTPIDAPFVVNAPKG